MASRGQGRRGRPRGNSQPSPVFYQQAFIEAMGAAIATIAQANAAEGQEGSSNLQRFKAHHPSTFMGGGIRWWLTIGFDKLKKFWRLWKSPPMLHGSD